MKFAINSGTLAETITASISSLPSRPPTPILGGVLIEAQIGAVTFSSFNYDRATRRTTAADVSDTDTVVVSGRLLAAVGGNLPKNADTVVTVDGNEVLITTGRTVFRLPMMHALDYPQLPAMDGSAVIGSVDPDVFADAVKVIGTYASTEPMPVNITALNITTTPGSMLFRATDRYIIGHRRIDWDGTAEVAIDVPASDVLPTIKALAAPGTSRLEILWDGGMFGLRTTSTTVITRALHLEPAFPNTCQIMTQPAYFAAITVPVGELMSMLKRAMSVADDQFAQVDVVVEDSELLVVSTRSATGNMADALSGVHYGGARRVAVSSRRLHQALAGIDDPQVTVGFREKGLYIHLHPGEIDESLAQPATDTAVLVAGIRS